MEVKRCKDKKYGWAVGILKRPESGGYCLECVVIVSILKKTGKKSAYFRYQSARSVLQFCRRITPYIRHATFPPVPSHFDNPPVRL